MGGSSLGAQAIFEFLKKKIKKNFLFIDNLDYKYLEDNKKKYLNLIISKSGNTIETIVNANILIKKKELIFLQIISYLNRLHICIIPKITLFNLIYTIIKKK